VVVLVDTEILKAMGLTLNSTEVLEAVLAHTIIKWVEMVLKVATAETQEKLGEIIPVLVVVAFLKRESLLLIQGLVAMVVMVLTFLQNSPRHLVKAATLLRVAVVVMVVHPALVSVDWVVAETLRLTGEAILVEGVVESGSTAVVEMQVTAAQASSSSDTQSERPSLNHRPHKEVQSCRS
jgi:hypothetical protein